MAKFEAKCERVLWKDHDGYYRDYDDAIASILNRIGPSNLISMTSDGACTIKTKSEEPSGWGSTVIWYWTGGDKYERDY
tara:strand:- start:128 stop:364 length:237 start_codon:yes stop_codon:yes gene_type:complete